MRVLAALDVVEDGQAHGGLRREAMLIEQLAFERGEEALADRVIVGTAPQWREAGGR